MNPRIDSKLRVCMMLPLCYEEEKTIAPQIGICSYITNFGHEVVWVVCSKEDYCIRPFVRDGVRIYAFPYRHYLPGNSMLMRIVNGIWNTIRKMRFTISLFDEGKYDIILYRVGKGSFEGLAAAYIKRKYAARFVLVLSNPVEHRDVVAHVHGKWRFWHYLVPLLDELTTRYLLRQADLILPISQLLQKDLIENKGVMSSRITPLQEGVDPERFDGRHGHRIRAKYDLINSTVVIYVGVQSRARRLELLIRAFSRALSMRGDLKLLMVGSGDDIDSLAQLASELGIAEQVTFTGQVPQFEIPDFIAAADIGVSPVPPLSFYKFSSPIKMFEYMASGKAVIANEEIPEHKEVLEESGGGILVPFTPEAFAQAIIEMLDNPEKAAEMGRRGREWVVKNRSFELMAREVEKRYYKLLER